MARRLLRSGFADGAVFHGYHAYECSLSAYIAWRGWAVPPVGATRIQGPRVTRVYQGPRGPIQDKGPHKARIDLFHELVDPADRAKPFWRAHVSLAPFLGPTARNDSLYYDADTDRLPHEVYPVSWATQLLPTVRLFVHQVWWEIR